MPRVVVDTSVSLPATLSPTGMARKLWVLFAFGALNHQIEQHRIELDLLRIDAETIGAQPAGLQRGAVKAEAAEQQRAILRDLLPDNAPEHWVNGLAKHYLDCAWISGQLRAKISRETVIRCLTKKLADAKKRESSNYAASASVDDLRKPLEEGGGWMAPLTGAPGRAAPIIRYVGTSITMSHARPAVRKHLIPLLWPDASAAQAAPAQGAA